MRPSIDRARNTLLICEIAKRLGVTLSVDSTVGEGTTVHIQIPSEVMQVKINGKRGAAFAFLCDKKEYFAKKLR